MEIVAAAGLLVLALLLFLLSTRQFRLWLRVAIWAGGAGVLAWSIVLVAGNEEHTGLFSVAADALAHIEDPSQSVLVQAFQRNAPTAQRFITPVLDVFLVLGALLGFVAILALTPGERIEKIKRPLAIGLIGAIAGGALALGVVGVGYGTPVRPDGYLAELSERSVQDGDTLWFGETSIRLFGVDAPELSQKCWEGEELIECGERARAELVRLLAESPLVRCDPKLTRTGRQRDALGRVLADCQRVDVGGDDNNAEIAQLMLSNGYAVEYEGRIGLHHEAAATAAREGRGVLAGCMLRPERWRRDAQARRTFLDGQLDGRDDLVGAGCPAVAPISSDNPR